jgi:hypothetical protein
LSYRKTDDGSRKIEIALFFLTAAGRKNLFKREVGRPKKEVLLRVSKRQQYINFTKKHH